MMSVMGIPQVHSNPSTRIFFRWIRHHFNNRGGNRLCRIPNGYYAEDDDNANESASPTAEDEGKVSLPIRVPGVSLSGRRTTQFIPR